MLIPSPRHTAKDLELWAELEAMDCVLGARPQLAAKAERSIQAIRSFTTHGPCYASISWGKDSVVLAYLCGLAGPRIPLVHIKALPVANPESYRVRDNFIERFQPRYHEIEIDYRSIDASLTFDEIEKAKDRIFFDAFAKLKRPHISGIRADESHGRKMRMRRWGLITDNTCAPLGWWSVSDVFAYLAINDLPVHPNYAMLGGGRWDRRHVRVDELAGERGTGLGRLQWEQEYYPEVYRRLQIGRQSGPS